MALIVLAGGNSTRMGGRDKGQLPLGQRTMAGVLLHRLSPLFGETFVVARDAKPYAAFPVHVIRDRYPGCGPIGGIHAGLQVSRDRWNFVLACDLPLMRVEVVEFLMERAHGMEQDELLIPGFRGSFEPVAAVYGKEVYHVPEEELRLVDPALESFFNVNTPAEYEQAQEILRRRGEL